MELEGLNIPSGVWDSADFVMAHAEHVMISDDGLQALVQPVRDRFARGFDNVEDAFGSTDDLDNDINLVYFETAANFCFWAQDTKDKWKFKYADNVSGGWYGLRNAFAQALADGVAVYDAAFMSTLSIGQAADLFRGEGGIQIPLIEQRVNNIVEAANFLLKEHGGSAKNFVASCDYSAPEIARRLTHNLASYRDGAVYEGRWVWFLKRAQIFPNDLSQLTQKYPEFVITDKDRLTIFADYKLPQILRHYGVLEYSDELTRRIDDHQLIANGSPEEIEIRAATIAACKKLSGLCPEMAIADIDVSLWLLSKDPEIEEQLKPHHMTVSYFY